MQGEDRIKAGELEDSQHARSARDHVEGATYVTYVLHASDQRSQARRVEEVDTGEVDDGRAAGDGRQRRESLCEGRCTVRIQLARTAEDRTPLMLGQLDCELHGPTVSQRVSRTPDIRLMGEDGPMGEDGVADGTDEILARLSAGREGSLRHVRALPERTAHVADWPDWAPAVAVTAWQARGIDRPWSHQVQAAQASWSGEHVVIATGTSSGKSLAFGLTAFHRILAPADGREATVLYLAPTKALAHDQLRSLENLDIPGVRAGVADGDSSTEERVWARRHANYLITNPDMLHHSILPGHASWASFLRRLSLVIVDEAHSYRGVFGAHIAAVLRRLRRLCAHYGTDPRFFLASATIASPEESAGRLVGSPVHAITDDTSPRPPVTIALWEPGEDDAGTPRSALAEAAGLLADLVVDDRQALAFVRSRRGAEAVASMARGHLAAVDPGLVGSVAAYRGGYLPEERRALEGRLRSGDLRGLATTSALEMGIDISGLDAVVTAGWPGTRASLWQQFGRAGRAEAPALAIFVARDDPLDSFLVAHPEAALDRPVEATVFDPGNPFVLAPHLCAAAQELPLTDEDLATWFAPSGADLVPQLVSDGLLRKRPTGWYWTQRGRASDLADLRGSGGMPVSVVELDTGRLLGTVDAASAAATVHPGAVYVHQGITHVITALDLTEAVALAHEETVDYFTIARTVSDIHIVDIEESASFGPIDLARGEVEVTSRVVSFQRKRLNGQSLGEEPLDLPEQNLRTRAVWWTIDDVALADAGIEPSNVPGAAHAAEHASIGLLPLFATCDRWDLGGVSTARHPDTGRPTIFVYDGFPGGAGFSAHGYAIARQWLQATRSVIAECSCSDGCPSCIQSPKCGNGNNPLDKAQAVALLDIALGCLT